VVPHESTASAPQLLRAGFACWLAWYPNAPWSVTDKTADGALWELQQIRDHCTNIYDPRQVAEAIMCLHLARTFPGAPTIDTARRLPTNR
jgi:hypothetical protein